MCHLVLGPLIIEFECFNQTHCHRCINHRCIKSSTQPLQSALTNSGEKMGRSEGLSDFKHGAVLGCHLFNKSVSEISYI